MLFRPTALKRCFSRRTRPRTSTQHGCKPTIELDGQPARRRQPAPYPHLIALNGATTRRCRSDGQIADPQPNADARSRLLRSDPPARCPLRNIPTVLGVSDQHRSTRKEPTRNTTNERASETIRDHRVTLPSAPACDKLSRLGEKRGDGSPRRATRRLEGELGGHSSCTAYTRNIARCIDTDPLFALRDSTYCDIEHPITNAHPSPNTRLKAAREAPLLLASDSAFRLRSRRSQAGKRQRRGWDSNPRTLAGYTISSRAVSTGLTHLSEPSRFYSEAWMAKQGDPA